MVIWLSVILLIVLLVELLHSEKVREWFDNIAPEGEEDETGFHRK